MNFLFFTAALCACDGALLPPLLFPYSYVSMMRMAMTTTAKKTSSQSKQQAVCGGGGGIEWWGEYKILKYFGNMLTNVYS